MPLTFLKRNRLPIILFFSAFLIRLIYLVDYSDSLFFQVHIADALYHEAWAARILGGDIFSLKMHGVLYKAPFYPYFIAFSYFISGSSNVVLMLLQVLMTAFSCVLIFLIGRRYLGDPAAFIGAMLYNFYFLSVYFSTEMEVPAVAIFLTLLSFYLLIIHEKPLPLIGSAMVFGFSVTALPTNVLLLLLYVFMLLKTRSGTKRGIKKAALFVVVALATIFPCTLRNLVAGHHFTPVSANGGINFYIGNNESYDETVYMQPGYKFEEFYDEPGRNAGANSFADRDQYWYKKAFHFIFSQPEKELSLILKKLVLYFSDYEICRNTDTYFAKETSIYKHIPFIPASVILALGLVGLALSIYKRKNFTLVLFCLLQALPCLIFFVTDRYRLPSMCVWALFSGSAIVFFVDSIRNRKWTAGVAASAGAVVLAVLSNLNLFVVRNPEYRPHLNLGFIYEAQMQYSRALKEYETALNLIEKRKPRDAHTESELHARKGNVQMTTDNLEAAEESFKKAVEVNPKSAPAYSYLGSLYARKKQKELAVQSFKKAIELNPRDVVSLHNFGRLYLDNKEHDQAVEKLKRAVELAPEHAGAHGDLAIVYAMQGKLDLMEEEAKKAIYYDPKGAPARYNLASLYLRTGRVDEAIAEYEQIIQTIPGESKNAYNQLGVISAQRNDLQRAVEYWEKALEIDPADSNARFNIMRAEAMMGR